MRTKAHPCSLDHDLAALAAPQAGVVSRRQLLALGLGSSGVQHRVAAGKLHPVPGHRGVFFVGHAAKGPGTMLAPAA